MLLIQFKVANAAFRDNEGNLDVNTVADEVRGIAERIVDGYTAGPVMDANGNTVGKWSLGD